jgi:hypothetical protein
MLAVRWWLLLVTACGRIGFTAADSNRGDSVGVVGHDEDGDGLIDTLDPCPYTAGDAADADGDGVGDACDPHPLEPIDHWTLFSPCTPDSPPPMTFDASTQLLDSIDATNTAGHILLPVVNTRVAMGFTIVERFAALDQHQIAMGPDRLPYYFVELDDNLGDTVAHTAVVLVNQVTNMYDFEARVPLATDVHLGSGSIVTDFDATGSQFTTDAGWQNERYMVAGPTAGYAGAPALRFVINGLHVHIEWIAAIESN